MKKLAALLLAMLMLTGAAYADYGTGAVSALDEQEKNAFDAILSMMEQVFLGGSSNGQYGFPEVSSPEDFRVLEYHYVMREDAADYVFLRFLYTDAYGRETEMDTYYEVSAENYPEDDVRGLAMFFFIQSLSGNQPFLSDTPVGEVGYFQQTWFTEDGEELMLYTRSMYADSIRRINEALDEYWATH